MSRAALSPIPALSLALLLAACGGKGVAGKCADIAACGGDPVGVWKIESMCEFNEASQPLLTVPIPSAISSPQTPALAGAPPSPTTTGDWCSGLVYLPPTAATNGTIGNVQFFAKPLQFVKGNIAFLADGSYSTNIFGASAELTHFTRGCLNAYGANPTCVDLQEGLNAQPLVNYVELTCSDGADNGCDCSYKLAETAGAIGTWRVEGSTLYQFGSRGEAPQQSDFCVAPDGQSMNFGGKAGTHLLASSGRRSMALSKCADPSCGEAEPAQ
jgi:hypothetical protein